MLQHAHDKVLDLTNWHEFLQCLERAGFRGSKMISSDNAVLFSYALWLLGRVDYDVPLDRLREVVARWFFMAHTTGRYTGAFESRFEQDTARLADLQPGDADGYIQILSRVFDDTLTADYWSITLPNELATSASKSPPLLAYIAALNILDADALLSTGKVRGRLDPAITARKGIERHHVFPRAYLRSELKITDNREINQIANMALVEWADNIAISDDAPSVYWPAQLAARNLPADMLARQRYWHALLMRGSTWTTRSFSLPGASSWEPSSKTPTPGSTSTDTPPVYPQPGHAPAGPPDTARSWTHHGVHLADLISADLLPAGATLLPAQGETETVATVLPDGKIAYEGEIYNTPSAASGAAAGSATNGWTYWAADTPDGRFTLAALRDEYLAQRQ